MNDVAGRRLVTTGELATELGVSTRTIARYVRDGHLTPAETTIGGHYRWEIDEVRRQIRQIVRDRVDAAADSEQPPTSDE